MMRLQRTRTKVCISSKSSIKKCLIPGPFHKGMFLKTKLSLQSKMSDSKEEDKNDVEAVAEETREASSPAKSNGETAPQEVTEESKPANNPLTEPGFHHHVVPTERSGALNVYVQVISLIF